MVVLVVFDGRVFGDKIVVDVAEGWPACVDEEEPHAASHTTDSVTTERFNTPSAPFSEPALALAGSYHSAGAFAR